jgi:hypothetical protein
MTPRVVRMTIISDDPSCGVTYHNSDDSRGVIYAPRVVNFTPKNIYSTSVVTHWDRHMMIRIFV